MSRSTDRQLDRRNLEVSHAAPDTSPGIRLTCPRHTYPGSIRFHKHHGQGRQDHESQKQLLTSDIVFTTYATVAAEARGAQSILGCIEWFRIVLDEGLSLATRIGKSPRLKVPH